MCMYIYIYIHIKYPHLSGFYLTSVRHIGMTLTLWKTRPGKWGWVIHLTKISWRTWTATRYLPWISTLKTSENQKTHSRRGIIQKVTEVGLWLHHFNPSLPIITNTQHNAAVFSNTTTSRWFFLVKNHQKPVDNHQKLVENPPKTGGKPTKTGGKPIKNQPFPPSEGILDFLHEARQSSQQHRVLVNCVQGISRSPAVAAGALRGR